MDQLAEIRIEAAGRSWRLSRPSSLDELWEAMVLQGPAFEDERIPYWVELWPASVALAEWLKQREAEINGKLCIDLGCGLGLSALTGTWLGARVLALDYEEAALSHTRLNARLNALPCPELVLQDWRHPALQKGLADLVWGADIVYEKRFARPILDFLSLSLADGGRAWIAEPGRGVFTYFLEMLPEYDFVAKLAHKASVSAPGMGAFGAPAPSIGIWEIKKHTF